jgi:hypothetical protein
MQLSETSTMYSNIWSCHVHETAVQEEKGGTAVLPRFLVWSVAGSLIQ